ncbi:MAG: sulfite exporter TauE/SafE family protein [Sedimentisphaeraceae bacterium JB056]
MELSITQWLIILLSAFLSGISKTGLPGVSILIVPLMAMVLPTKESVGLVLPTLIFADIFAAFYYRKHAHWKHLMHLMPCTLLGIIAGFIVLKRIESPQLRPIIGAIVMAMLIIQTCYEYYKNKKTSSDQNLDAPAISRPLAVIFGFAAGMTTMMANAAGPVMILYLLASGLPKNEFIGTRAWFFFIINWVKVPFSIHLGLITAASLKVNLMAAPAIAIGAIAGILLLKHIPQKLFRIVARVMAALSALKLLS